MEKDKAKNRGGVGSKRKATDEQFADVETVDLTGDDVGEGRPEAPPASSHIFVPLPSTTPAKRSRIERERSASAALKQCQALDPSVTGDPATREETALQAQQDGEVAQQTPITHGLPTPSKTPSKPTGQSASDFQKLAERYTATPTKDGIQQRNTQKFCLKPPFWQRWSPEMYASFAEHLQSQFDPTDFCSKHNITTQEATHVFTALVHGPLHDAKEASRRGEEGMEQLLECYNKYGTPLRHWGRPRAEDGKRVYGELAGVQRGMVLLITSTGNRYGIKVDKLIEADARYLKGTLSAKDEVELYGTRVKLVGGRTQPDVSET